MSQGLHEASQLYSSEEFKGILEGARAWGRNPAFIYCEYCANPFHYLVEKNDFPQVFTCLECQKVLGV